MTLLGPVFVTGGTGYLGSGLVQRLLDQGIEVRAIARSQAGQRRLDSMGASFVQLGSPEMFAPMRQAIAGSKAAMHLVGAHLEVAGSTFAHTIGETGRIFAQVAAAENVTKAVLVSCVGPATKSPRLGSQRLAEAALRQAGVPYTILRLAPVYGPGSRLMSWLNALAEGSQAPAAVDAGQRWRPIHVVDALEGMLRVLDPDVAVDSVVELGGAESLTLRELAERLDAAHRLRPPQRELIGRLPVLRRLVGDGKSPRDLPMPEEDLLLDFDPGPEGAALLGLNVRSLDEGLRRPRE